MRYVCSKLKMKTPKRIICIFWCLNRLFWTYLTILLALNMEMLAENVLFHFFFFFNAWQLMSLREFMYTARTCYENIFYYWIINGFVKHWLYWFIFLDTWSILLHSADFKVFHPISDALQIYGILSRLGSHRIFFCMSNILL